MLLDEYRQILNEIEDQQPWRHRADKEMDYVDGKQLDSELLQKQKQLGIPPAMENVIKPAIQSVEGYEINNRADWRVTAKDNNEDVADVLNKLLNEAETESKADRACTRAFHGQLSCGIGWVEVSRNPNPFEFPYRCKNIDRNQMWWDMSGDIEECNWMLRKVWVHIDKAKLMFPEHTELFERRQREDDIQFNDGGHSTGQADNWGEVTSRNRAEQYWYNPSNKHVLIVEVWYRQYEQIETITTPNGRVVEFDPDNLNHAVAVATGVTPLRSSIVPRMYRDYWCGKEQIHTGRTPYKHERFPYVPFIGFTEDNSGIPYGVVRDMIYSQDNINSAKSKLRWGMSVVRVERTKGAVLMTDAQLREQVARPDADIVLDQREMAKQGAKFEVHRDYQLSDQHYAMIADDREAIKRVSSITDSFMGHATNSRSATQDALRLDQSNQSISSIMDNFREARMQVGELLLALIIEDMGSEPHEEELAGDIIKPRRTVTINEPTVDERTGQTYLNNDIQRTRLKVELEDVPSTPTYRSQQYTALSEAVKSLPPEYQTAAMPFLVHLMDIPFKNELVEKFREVQERQLITPEAVEQQIEQVLQQAQHDLKEREVALKERKVDSEIKNLDAKSVQVGVQAAFAAMQAGAQVAQIPQITPIADSIMKGAGYKEPTDGDDPNFPSTDTPMDVPQEPVMDVPSNTSPNFPATGMNGINTENLQDNI